MSEKAENIQFIEVRKVVGDKISGKNVDSSLEIIPISDIKGCREWHKGINDSFIKGEMSLLVIKIGEDKMLSKIKDGKVKPIFTKTILIEESYTDFLYRLSRKAVVKDIEGLLHEST